jgi:hypothetical protein
MYACFLRQMPRSNNRHREPLIITIEVVLSDSSSNNVLITGTFVPAYSSLRRFFWGIYVKQTYLIIPSQRRNAPQERIPHKSGRDIVTMKWKDQRLPSRCGQAHPSEECLARFAPATCGQLHRVSFAVGVGAITAIWLVRGGFAAYQTDPFLA